jgi:hypothetical protein
MLIGKISQLLLETTTKTKDMQRISAKLVFNKILELTTTIELLLRIEKSIMQMQLMLMYSNKFAIIKI